MLVMEIWKMKFVKNTIYNTIKNQISKYNSHKCVQNVYHEINKILLRDMKDIKMEGYTMDWKIHC